MKILVTGFDPFGGEPVNSALEAVMGMADEIAGAQIIKLEIPTVFGLCIEKVREAIIAHQPDVVMCVGQAGRRFGVTPEKVAINLDDLPYGADNAGNCPKDQPVAADGPAAYFSTIPVKAMTEAIKAKGLPASVSYTAGTAVCNHMMYGALHLAATEFPGLRAGFVHVPFVTKQVVARPGFPSMKLEDITTALEACVETIVKGEEDEKIVGGQTH
ncbi:MAG: pyroglutamyl-peptidase I [Oscillospiraceae bacterium]|nr:pyroglutamyl-peptidase I [Oscillospiraceae bacterium]MBR6607211.1 pyroglutamyl-peptidase I [Oscillospiraceae bacterium]